MKPVSTIIFCMAAVMLGLAVKQSFFDRPAPVHRVSVRESLLGRPLAMSGAATGKSDVSLLMLISTHCQFCERSAPFYRRLSAMREKGADFRLIAAFPEGQPGGGAYLDKHAIHADEVESRNFRDIGIQGTPTLLMVRAGVIREVWEGWLDRQREQNVLAKLGESCASCLALAGGAAGEAPAPISTGR